MSITTENFKLIKPELTDTADITAFDSNWDKIDARMANIVTYYNANKSVDDLIDPIALIPVSSTLNSELFAILGGTYAYVETLFYGSAKETSRRIQIAHSYNSGDSHIAKRTYSSNGWLPWIKIIDENDLEGFVSKSGDTMTGALRVKSGANATNGIRLNSASSTGAVLMDQTDIVDDNSDRTGIKIMHDASNINEIAQLFRTENNATDWYQLYGQHNTNIELKTYSNLANIDITVGNATSETIYNIAHNLPNNSMLVVGITSNNQSIYPSNYGLLTVKRTSASRIEFGFVATNGSSFSGFYTIVTGGDTWSGWGENAQLSGGVLPVNKGGTGVSTIADTTYTTARYRASALVSVETTPSTNGVINWLYE